MLVKTTINKKDGKLRTEVVDRGEHLCSAVYKVSNLVGTQESDEEIGPEGDEVHEVTRG